MHKKNGVVVTGLCYIPSPPREVCYRHHYPSSFMWWRYLYKAHEDIYLFCISDGLLYFYVRSFLWCSRNKRPNVSKVFLVSLSSATLHRYVAPPLQNFRVKTLRLDRHFKKMMTCAHLRCPDKNLHHSATPLCIYIHSRNKANTKF